MSTDSIEAQKYPEAIAPALFECRYDLTPDEVNLAIRDYVELHNVPTHHRLVGVVLGSDEGAVSNAARTRECQEFQGIFLSNGSQWMADTYRQADENGRRFFTVFDLGDKATDEQAKVAGVMSVADSLPCMSLEDAGNAIPYNAQDIRAYHSIHDHEKIVDVLTLAIAPGYRARLMEDTAVMALLEGIFVRIGLQEDWGHIVTMVDVHARRVLDAVGIPFKPMHGHDEPFEYLGSPETYALYGKFEDFVPSVSSHYRSYGRSLQRWRDAVVYARNRLPGGNRDRFKAAAKRLGTFMVARNVITGIGVADRIVLPPGAMSIKVG